MITCRIHLTGQRVGEGGLGAASFAHLPRPKDRLRLTLPGAPACVYEVVTVEHVGVHESTDRGPDATGHPGQPAGAPLTVLHVQLLDADPEPTP